MQKLIEKELQKNNREKIDYRIFHRKTKIFLPLTQEAALTLAGDLRMGDQFFPSEDLVLQRYVGANDRNGKKIFEGDYLLTNEGNWRGFVVFCDGMFELTDAHGGYSAEPEWDQCEVLSNIGEMDGNTQKYFPPKKGDSECSQQDSSPIVRFMNVPY